MIARWVSTCLTASSRALAAFCTARQTRRGFGLHLVDDRVAQQALAGRRLLDEPGKCLERFGLGLQPGVELVQPERGDDGQHARNAEHAEDHGDLHLSTGEVTSRCTVE